MLRIQFRFLVLAALATAVAFGPECYGALATAASGTKRFTARLSANRALRKQQLIVDPEGILGGSVSVSYNTRLVRLVGVIDPANYEVTGGLIGVIPSFGGLSQDLIPLDEFFNSTSSLRPPDGVAPSPTTDPYRELGYVQIFFDRRDEDVALRAPSGGSVINNLPGYVTVGEDGETGVTDTHALLFEYLPGAANQDLAGYTVFATAPREKTVSDFLILEDDPGNPVPYTELRPARVIGSLMYDEPRPGTPAVPLPPALAIGGSLLGLMAARRALRLAK
jgi:hypothetical protein